MYTLCCFKNVGVQRTLPTVVKAVCKVKPAHVVISMQQSSVNRQTSGESPSVPQYLGCNTAFDMRLRVTFLRRKTVSLQSNIAHRE